MGLNFDENSQGNTDQSFTGGNRTSGGYTTQKEKTEALIRELYSLGQTENSALGDGQLSRFMEGIDKIRKDDRSQEAIECLQITTPDLIVPAIIFYAKRGKEVRFWNIIPEALFTKPLENRVEKIRTSYGDQNIEIDSCVSLAYNATYVNFCIEALANTLKVDREFIKPTYHWALPADSKTDVRLDSPNVIRDAYNTAKAAISDALAPKAPLNLAKIADAGAALIIDNHFCHGDINENTDGEIAGADIKIKMSVELDANNQHKSNDIHHDSGHLNLVSTNIKMVLLRRQNPTQMYQNFGGPIAPNREIHKIMVLNGTEALYHDGSPVTESHLTPILALMAASPAATGENWRNIYTSVMRTNKVTRSLALLGYLYEPFAPIEPFVPRELDVEYTLQPTSEDKINFNTLIAKFFAEDSLTVAMDFPKGSRSSHANSMMVRAAYGDFEANLKIIEDINGFLGGDYFSLALQQFCGRPDAMLFNPTTTTIHLGHYTTQDGQKRPWYDIDLLEMLGLLKEQASNPELQLNEFADSFFPGATMNGDGLRYLDARRKVIKTAEPSAVFTDLADRCFMAPGVMNALAAAMVAANVKLTPRGLVDTETLSNLASAFVPNSQIGAEFAQACFQSQQMGNGGNFYQNNFQGGNFYR